MTDSCFHIFSPSSTVSPGSYLESGYGSVVKTNSSEGASKGLLNVSITFRSVSTMPKENGHFTLLRKISIYGCNTLRHWNCVKVIEGSRAQCEQNTLVC